MKGVSLTEEEAEALRKAYEYQRRALTCPKCGSQLVRVDKYKYRCPKCGYEKVWYGFTWSEVEVPPWVLRSLMFKGYLEITYKSRRYTVYRVRDDVAIPQDVEPEEVAVPPDLFESIIGYDEVKEILWKIVKDEVEGNVGVLLVGPPASAKSLFIMELSRVPGTYLTTMGTTTRVGLREVIIDLEPRILLIDEIDKYRDPRDITVLLSVLDPGVITDTRHGRKYQKFVHMHVVAAANTLRKLPEELISRFRPYIFHLGGYDDETLTKIIVHMCKRMGRDESLAIFIADRIINMGYKDPRAGINLCKVAKTIDEAEKLIGMLKRYRSSY